MKMQSYDLIGDIHGQYDKATGLLGRLGYVRDGTSFQHAEGRKVIFLGDYIDRGPKIRETLELVRGMVEAGDALAIMGNHEFNAIAYATPDGNGGFLRQHTPTKQHQHAATLAQFAESQHEWAEWIEWMKRLPMFLDLGGLRCVHACWDAKRIPLLEGRDLTDPEFLQACATRKFPEFHAVENILKGPELFLPEGVVFKDKEGVPRPTVRTRWWQNQVGMKLGDMVMPRPVEIDHIIRERHLKDIPNYSEDAPPVFFGHYWMPPDLPKQPLARNIACLDYSAAFGDNPLIAYRWDGEAELSVQKFVASTGVEP